MGEVVNLFKDKPKGPPKLHLHWHDYAMDFEDGISFRCHCGDRAHGMNEMMVKMTNPVVIKENY